MTIVVASRAGAGTVLGERGRRSRRCRSRRAGRSAPTCASRKSSVAERDVHRAADACPCAGRSATEARSRPRRSASSRSASTASSSAVEERRPADVDRRRRLAVALDVAVAVDEAGEDLRPAEVDADDAVRAHEPRGYPTPPHGRRREAVPRLPRRPREGQGAAAARRPERAPERNGRSTAGRASRAARPKPRRRWTLEAQDRRRRCCSCSSCSWSWAVASYFSLPQRRRGRRTSGCRTGASAALAHQNALLLSNPTNILCSAPTTRTPTARVGGPALRLDHAPPHRSVPPPASSTCRSRATCACRFPGTATQKINAAMQIGGPPLAIRTIRGLHRACRSTT